MVSADNLNLDVLEHIFSFLSGNDLPSVALVSKSFLAAVIPRLYSSILYRVRQEKGYNTGDVMSPFAAIVAHPDLAVHVRNIEIRAVPTIKSRLNPIFAKECCETIHMAKNLASFRCTVPGILPLFLPFLEEKERLETLLVHANLKTDTAKMLAKLNRLQRLTLEFATWNVVDLLPSWSQNLSQTLTTLTLFMINELHEHVLESTLKELPSLQGLHVVGCPKIDHVVTMKQVVHTPLLQSLSLTTSESTRALDLPPPPLHHLRHLALDTRYNQSPSPSPTILASLLTHIKTSFPSLQSFTLKLPERKVVIGEAFITQLVEQFGSSLRRLAFLDCGISLESLTELCSACHNLETLEISIPTKDLLLFSASIAHCKKLHTLVDAHNHVEHSTRKSFTSIDIGNLLVRCPSLRTIETSHRIWTGRVESAGDVTVKLERRLSHTHKELWFMPRE
ncbi:hypothetical protein D9619_009874 [Psilocybe cf. subviscida]|uniref:F-box domain-containing protein n=1 Tax=Psilocybe cf. subviscida TaxID=2480587 RepID=A0A8H5F6H3_9AGAR|nr:hypothetical protein D9619_009874 [Psilocybe cf. subviscida]